MASLTLQLQLAEDDDKQLSCFVCGYPRHGQSGRMIGPEVEYVAHARAACPGWLWSIVALGLHASCLDRTAKMLGEGE